MDHSTFSRSFGVLSCFVEGKANFHLTQLPQSEQRKLLLSFLSSSFNDSRAETYEPWVVSHNWGDEPFARGAYTGFLTPGALSTPALWKAFRTQEKLPNVYFAGADYHAGFGNGYIEGAIRSGQRAAARIHARLRRAQTQAQGTPPCSGIFLAEPGAPCGGEATGSAEAQEEPKQEDYLV